MKAMTKRERIIFLLEHWHDYTEPANSTGLPNSSITRTTSTYNGSAMPPMATHRSVLELNRCLELCQRMAPGHYKHLAGYYAAPTRTVDKPAKIRNAHGKMTTTTARTCERVVPRWVLGRMVERATDFICGAYNGDAELPRSFTRKLRALADSDGWTEAA